MLVDRTIGLVGKKVSKGSIYPKKGVMHNNRMIDLVVLGRRVW